MKTQTYTTRILTAIIALLMVTFTVTEAAAQRRSTGNDKTNVRRVETKTEKNIREEKSDRKDYQKAKEKKADNDRRKDVRRENDRADRRSDEWRNDDRQDKGKGKPNGRDKDRDRDRGDRYDHNARPDHHPAYVHIDPPRFHDGDYQWHHYKNVRYRHLPRKAVWIMIEGEHYAYYKGRFYLPGPFGFYKVTPPVYLHHLPEGCIRVMIDGRPGWGLHGILFLETPFGFRVIV